MTPPHLSAAVASGSLLFLSGQLAFRDGALLTSGIADQTRQVLDNIEAVLATHGLDRAAVVKATIWLRSAEDFPVFNEVYAEFFGAHRPARSTVVSDLVLPGADIEIEVVAAFADGSRS